MRRGIVILAAFLTLSAPVRAAEIPEDIKTYCEEVGEVNGIAPELLEAIAYCESGFQDHATNKAGTCFGLCQIYKKFHVERMERLGVSDIFDRKGNIMICGDILGELFEEHEDVGLVLLIYGGASDKTKERYLKDGTLPKWASRIINKSIEYEKGETK